MGPEYILQLVDPARRKEAERCYRELSGNGRDPAPDVLLALLRARGLLAPGSNATAGGDVEVTVLADQPQMGTVLRAGPKASMPGEPAASPQTREAGHQKRFDLLGEIGAGSMGEVLLARDRDLGRKVAYKRLHGKLVTDSEVFRRFLAEAQITAQLDHPNVVPLYSLEREDDQRLGYAMKLVEGETLAALIKEARSLAKAGQPLPPRLQRESLLDHFLKVCDAVAFAHARGVIHRDLKPANIMAGRFNEVYVMDWGIARVLDTPELLPTGAEAPVQSVASGGERSTVWGSLIGTPRYMSPEQARGEIDRLDPRSDLYSLGLILFELVCLRPAFTGPDLDTLLERVRQGRREPVAAPSPRLRIPRELQAIITEATAAERSRRYDDVKALARDLRNHVRGYAVSALPDNLLRKTLRWIGHHRDQALALFLASLLLGTVAAGGLWYRNTATLWKVGERALLLTRYFDRVSEKAHRIEEHFLYLLGLLEGLSVGAELALEHGGTSPDKYYLRRDFELPGQGPKDLAASRHYQDLLISTEHPSYFYKGEKLSAELEEKFRRLVPLTNLFKRLFLEAYRQHEVPASGQKVREVLEQRDRPLAWAEVGLKEGALVEYPGNGGVLVDYDPVARPWYQQALPAAGRKICGPPYLGAAEEPKAMYISCSVALYEDGGELLGVAALDIPFDHSVRKLLRIPGFPIRRSLLLTSDGEILVKSLPDGQQQKADDSHDANDFPLYFNPDVVQAAADGRSGFFELPLNGEKLWIVHIHLPQLQWTLVVEFSTTEETERLWGLDSLVAGNAD